MPKLVGGLWESPEGFRFRRIAPPGDVDSKGGGLWGQFVVVLTAKGGGFGVNSWLGKTLPDYGDPFKQARAQARARAQAWAQAQAWLLASARVRKATSVTSAMLLVLPR